MVSLPRSEPAQGEVMRDEVIQIREARLDEVRRAQGAFLNVLIQMPLAALIRKRLLQLPVRGPQQRARHAQSQG